MEISKNSQDMASALANKFIELSNAQSCLSLQHTEHFIFKDLKVKKLDSFAYKEKPIPDRGQWDIVLGDFPFGMKASNLPWLDNNIKNYSVATIIKCLPLISHSGYGVFTIEPIAYISHGLNFRKLLEDSGFSIVALFNTPKGFWSPYMDISTPFVVVKKGNFHKEFYGELESVEQINSLIEGFFKNLTGNNLSTGFFGESNKFPGFREWKVQQRVNELETEYKNFKKKKLSEIVLAVNLCKTGKTFTHIPNSVYLPKIGAQNAVNDPFKTVIKHQNYFQIVCNPEFVDAGYLASFFNSRLGKLIINTLPSGTFIPSINKESILSAEIALPDLGTQKEIFNTITKLALVKEKISSFENELTVRPISSNQTLKQIDSILEVVGELAEADKIKSLTRDGESKEGEFKETLSLDVRRQIKSPEMETEVIKTIAGFMNTEGGELLVGVNDSGKIVGVDKEIEMFHKSKDRFLLHFKNLIKNRIGEQFRNYALDISYL